MSESANGATLLVKVEEAARLLAISRNHAYELIREGRLPHVRLGRVIRVPRFALEEWIAREAGVAAPPPRMVGLPPQRH